jgi:hypothetical protein
MRPVWQAANEIKKGLSKGSPEFACKAAGWAPATSLNERGSVSTVARSGGPSNATSAPLGAMNGCTKSSMTVTG